MTAGNKKVPAMRSWLEEGLMAVQQFQSGGVHPKVLAHLPCAQIPKSTFVLQNPGLTDKCPQMS